VTTATRPSSRPTRCPSRGGDDTSPAPLRRRAL
jgi:hypothetical protein